jgi:hypothetical protein
LGLTTIEIPVDTNFLDTLKQLSLLDAAVRLEIKQRRRPGEELPQLSELFPEYPESEIASALKQASSLANSAYSYGDSLIGSKFTNGHQIFNDMRRSHPGFSEETYGLALDFGCFQAR